MWCQNWRSSYHLLFRKCRSTLGPDTTVARHGTVNLEWSARLRFTTRRSCTMVLLSSILSLILSLPLFSSSQMFIFRVATFVGPSAITNLSLAARLGWLRPKRSGPSPVSHCTTLPSVSDQLGVCATCLYCVFVVLIKHTTESLVLC